jgi:hypothetical protein
MLTKFVQKSLYTLIGTHSSTRHVKKIIKIKRYVISKLRNITFGGNQSAHDIEELCIVNMDV